MLKKTEELVVNILNLIKSYSMQHEHDTLKLDKAAKMVSSFYLFFFGKKTPVQSTMDCYHAKIALLIPYKKNDTSAKQKLHVT